MSPATAVFNGPTTLLTLSPELVSCSAYPTSKLVFSRKKFVNRAWGFDTVMESVKTRELKGSARDEGVRAFEQEVLTDGSPEFRPSDVATGLESKLNRLSKWLVAALFSTVILWRHDAEALWAALGSVLNAGLSNTLKQIVNQERPVSTLGSGPGMPSSHAQSIFFAVVFAIVSIVDWLGLNGLTITLTGLLLALGSYLSWLRVSQQLHTASQVVVGAVLGSVFAILWFWSWDAIVLKAFISHLWVRAVVILGAAGFCLGFILYVIRSLSGRLVTERNFYEVYLEFVTIFPVCLRSATNLPDL